jgi:hypothetical protein
VKIYGVFVLVEFLVLALALMRAHREGIDPLFFGVAILVLLLLPMFRFGPVNDLSTRGSAPALIVLMFAVIDGWARPLKLWGRGVLVTGILLIGALTPMSEIIRAVSWTPWQLDLQRSLYEATRDGQAPNYFTDLRPGSLLARMLRPPAPPA